MKTEIYNLLRSYCVSDTAAENATEKIVEYLKNSEKPIGFVGNITPSMAEAIEMIRSMDHKGTIIIIGKEEKEPEHTTIESYVIKNPNMNFDFIANEPKHTHKRKSSREI